MYGFSYSGTYGLLNRASTHVVSDYSMYVASILHRKRYGMMKRKRG